MASVSRTIGPLHFEDLEPKRFEDLVRQIIYDFKPWRRLEATGRAGSDDGFDARGFEMVSPEFTASPNDEEETGEHLVGVADRLWLLQCKRERAIGPTKLLGYLDEITLTEQESLHGIVFAAACDFSKTARDQFQQKCESMGVAEWHLWGKAELEDKLFRPENDSILFAYFGFSLAIRRRSLRADIRARLVMKRKAHRVLADKTNFWLLIRSPEAPAYPNSDETPDFPNRPQWVVRKFSGFTCHGAAFCLRRHFAYLSPEGDAWDAAMGVNDARASTHDDPWLKCEPDHARHQTVSAEWNSFPEHNRAWLELIGVIEFEDILEIDEIGDEYIREPHLYVQFQKQNGPFKYFYWKLETVGSWDRRTLYPKGADDGARIVMFSDAIRELEARD